MQYVDCGTPIIPYGLELKAEVVGESGPAIAD